nr:uncharacterized protein LOC129274361 [Lytechinus pictus]
MRQKNKNPKKHLTSYVNYGLESIEEGMRLVSRRCSIRKAAVRCGVPEATLRNRLARRHTGPRGHPTTLTYSDEEALSNHLVYMAECGYGLNRSQVLELATQVHQERVKSPVQQLTTRWFYGFMRRWPALRVIRPRSLAINRAISTTPERIARYYHELDKILIKYDLKDKPRFIYNVDETGFNQEHSPLRVVSGSRRSPSIVSCRSATTTLLACGSAEGHSLPPYIVFKGKNLMSELTQGSLPGSRFEMTDSGWSNGEVFRRFLSKHFIPSLPDREAEQRVLLLYDGHKSHITVPLIEEARQHNVILFLLPPHTSHILQPLDVGCFGPMKAHFNRQCTDFLSKHPGRSISRFDMTSLISHAYLQAMREENLKAAFRKSGNLPI